MCKKSEYIYKDEAKCAENCGKMCFLGNNHYNLLTRRMNVETLFYYLDPFFLETDNRQKQKKNRPLST